MVWRQTSKSSCSVCLKKLKVTRNPSFSACSSYSTTMLFSIYLKLLVCSSSSGTGLSVSVLLLFFFTIFHLLLPFFFFTVTGNASAPFFTFFPFFALLLLVFLLCFSSLFFFDAPLSMFFFSSSLAGYSSWPSLFFPLFLSFIYLRFGCLFGL